MQELTERQQQVLDYITNYLSQHGCPPTIREISERIGVKGTATAMVHLDALERKGFISRRDGARGIALTTKPIASISLPVVGTVRAGQPELAVEDISEYCIVDPSWVKGSGCFFLRVQGDSMIEAGIYTGDLALIHPQPSAVNGEIVVAMVDGEATLKRFFMEKDRIRLQPENPTMEPIIINAGEAETIIIGKLLRIVRKYA